MQPLPFVDQHSRPVDAPAAAVWCALLKVLREMGGTGPLARILGCDPLRGTAEFAGRPGDAVPGFRVDQAEPGSALVLRGRHRFANYSLTFRIDGRCLSAETHAEFPGFRGRLYRAMVIGSGGHRLITRHLLRRIARAACRTPPTGGE